MVGLLVLHTEQSANHISGLELDQLLCVECYQNFSTQSRPVWFPGIVKKR